MAETDANAYTPPGYEPLFDRYWKAHRRAQLLIGLWALFVGISFAVGFYADHLRGQLAESEVARDEQAKQLAAFMAESDYGVKPAEIIESLQAKVRGLEDANTQNELEIAGLHGALVSCEFPGNFAGPESTLPDGSLGGGSQRQEEKGPIRTESK